MASLKIVTWNVNSVRLRIEQALKVLAMTDADVLCLQETKCRDSQFPRTAFEEAGYPHVALAGQKGMHGVATVSRRALDPRPTPDLCREGHARIAVCAVEGVEIENYYVPSGGDDPDPEANPKFAHKLDFVDRMTARYAAERDRFAREPVVAVGDFNIAPREHDVWSHKQMQGVVSHTEPEITRLDGAAEAGGFTDAARALIPEPEKVYTWWSYRARDWRASNRGRRLDHIWVSPPLADGVRGGGRDRFKVWDEARDWEKPSDHAPVSLTIQI